MAKFTVFFRDKAIHTAEFEAGVVHIGSDDTNNIVINSLAVAPIHAAVVIRDNGTAMIKQLSEKFPLIINGERIKMSNLHDGDVLTVGKHTVLYQETLVIQSHAQLRSALPTVSLIDDEDEPIEIAKEENVPRTATLQVTSGQNIGKIMTIKNPMTRLGAMGSGVAVITKRQNGYFLSILENTGSILLNNMPLGDNSLKLNSGDTITINKAEMQFFLS